MGKAKKTKKSNSRVAATPSKEQSQLEAELGSLEESKRIRACKVLVDLYATNATKNNSSATLSSLTSSAILSTLSMRLVDFSAEVRKLAIEAVSSLCCSSDAQILERIVNSGLFRSVAALVMDSSAMAGNGLDTHVLYPQLLVAIANIVQVYPTATNEINDLMSQLIEFLFSKLAAGSSAFYQNTIDTALSLLEALASSNTELARLILSHPYLDTVRTVAGQTAERVAAVVGSISTLDTIKTEDFDADYLRELLGAVKSSSLLLSLFFGAYEAKQSNSLCNSCCVEQQMSLVNSTVTLVVALICKLGVEETSASNDAQTKNPMEMVDETDTSEREDEEEIALDTPLENSKLSVFILLEEIFKSALGVIINISERLKSGIEADDILEFCSAAVDDSSLMQSIPQSAREQSLICVQLLGCTSNNVVINAEKALLQSISTMITLTSQFPQETITSTISTCISCLDNLLTLEESFVESQSVVNLLFGRNAVVFHGTENVETLLVAIELGFSILENTTITVKDGAGESKWGYAPDVDESDFRCTILACLSSAIETAGNIVKFCNSPSTNFRIQDEIVSKIALTLVRGTSFPQLEAAGPCVVAMPSMIQKDSGQMQGKINALLSNCLLKRMSDPNCYSGTIDFTKLEAKGTTTVKKKNKTAAKNEQNLMQSTLLLSDSCINSFIDMHSSDSEEYLSYFTKLRALEILSEVSTRFKQRVQVAFASLEEIDESRFYETIENLDSFISYKSDYLRAH